MNVTKCLNGHFYDADKYSECPHCGAKSAVNQSQAPADDKNQKKSHSFFGKKKEENASDLSQMPDRTIGKTFGIFGDEDTDKKPQNDDVPAHAEPVIFSSQVTEDVKEPEIISEDITDKETNNVSVSDSEKPVVEVDSSKSTPSLADAVKKSVASSEGKTVGYFSTGASSSNDAPAEPVVGWLVCLKGKHFGESFNISAGRNSIGRGNDNKIILNKENTISREKHAWITYEPKKREFFVQPGESSGLTYLNGDNIMESKKLSANDKLEFGDGMFIFIPLCGENFTWEDYINKE